MKGFIAFLLCAMFLAFASVDLAQTAQRKAEVGYNIGVPVVIDMPIEVSATVAIMPHFEYGLLYSRVMSGFLSNETLQCNSRKASTITRDISKYTYNSPDTDNTLNMHIDPGLCPCV